MSKKNWVDYKDIKKNISLQMVLEKYQVFSMLRRSGNNLGGICPD